MAPAIRGVVDRRILINYRVPTESLEAVVPEPFRPREAEKGMGLGSVCIMRLKNERPRLVPSMFGTSFETVTHRISVECDEGGEKKNCVYVPRRDTSSRVGTLAVKRLMPGDCEDAEFETDEKQDRHHVRINCDTEVIRASVEEAEKLPEDSVFGSIEDASQFFLDACIRYSRSGSQHGAVEFRAYDWNMSSLRPLKVRSSYFERLEGSEYDSSLLMNDIKHEWHRRKPIAATR